MDYDVYVRREAFEFLRHCRVNERELLLKLLRSLGQDPYRRGDFTERDQSGRDVEVVVSRRYAILFWADHAAKEVKIIEIRPADR
jgi:hypothetical protein